MFVLFVLWWWQKSVTLQSVEVCQTVNGYCVLVNITEIKSLNEDSVSFTKNLRLRVSLQTVVANNRVGTRERSRGEDKSVGSREGKSTCSHAAALWGCTFQKLMSVCIPTVKMLTCWCLTCVTCSAHLSSALQNANVCHLALTVQLRLIELSVLQVKESEVLTWWWHWRKSRDHQTHWDSSSECFYHIYMTCVIGSWARRNLTPKSDHVGRFPLVCSQTAEDFTESKPILYAMKATM